MRHETWAALAAEYPELEDAPTAKTQTGDGFHKFFGLNGDRIGCPTAALLGAGIDVKAEGGSVILPSAASPGREWVPGRELGAGPLPGLPRAIAERLTFTTTRPARRRAAREGAKVSEGRRNKHLASVAGTIRRPGLSTAVIAAALAQENAESCAPPLAESEVEKIAASIAQYPPAGKIQHLTDTGNAERVIAYCGDRTRYCAVEKSWHIFDGRRWALDDTLYIEHLAGEATRGLYAEAAGVDDPDMRRKIAQWALASEAAARRRAAVEVARSDRRVVVRVADFDRNPWDLNCLSGTIDLRSGKLRPHDSADMLSKLAPVVYDLAARSELWERVLLEACGGDEEYAAYLQRWYGYAASGETSEEIFAAQVGPTQTSKSTVNEAIKAAMGDYAATVDAGTLSEQKYGSATRDDLLQLDGRRLAVSSEAHRGARFDTAMLKLFTGGDTMKKRGLYRVPRDFRPSAKIVLHTNDTPMLPDDDEAIWRRFHVQPFVHKPARINPHFKATLRDVTVSGPAILAWLVRGHMEWCERGLDPPKVVLDATSALRVEMNPLSDYFEQCCRFDPALWCSRSSLLSSYYAWCKDGNAQRPIGAKDFAARVRAKGCREEWGNRVRGWSGVGLRGLQE